MKECNFKKIIVLVEGQYSNFPNKTIEIQNIEK